MFFFNKQPVRRDVEQFESSSNDEPFDVDSIVPKKSGITSTTPRTAEKWQHKLESEDAHIRNMR